MRTAPRIALATSVVLALGVATAFGGHRILPTDSPAAEPVSVDEAVVSFAEGLNTVVEDAAINAQGELGERTVKEFSQDEPFSMFALTWEGDHDVVAFVRAVADDGSWGPWYGLDEADNGESVVNGTELVYVEPTTKVQVSTLGVDLFSEVALDAAENAEAAAQDVAQEAAQAAEQEAETITAGAEDAAADVADVADAAGAAAEVNPDAPAEPEALTTAASDISAVFIDGNAQEGGVAPVAASTTTGMPDVVTRAGWGADESLRCSETPMSDSVRALTIHHTAGSNNYTRAEAAAQMRGIYYYHAKTLGWCDIGYNALVDKYGTIYEGRYGGLAQAVQGAHAGGFNEDTWGIAMIGDYTLITPSDATVEAVGRLAGWRAAVAGFEPDTTVTLVSEGTSYSKYPAGTQVTLPRIFAHRDVGLTTCPGEAGYAQMSRIRAIAEQTWTAITTGTAVEDTDSTTTATNTVQVPGAEDVTLPELPADLSDVQQALEQGADTAAAAGEVGGAVSTLESDANAPLSEDELSAVAADLAEEAANRDW